MTPPTMTPAPPRPTPGPARPYHFPRFEEARLSNGVRIVVAPVSKLPVVTVVALVEAGAVADPAGREGVASLTAAALAEGTAGGDGAQLADRLERLGASFESSADWDGAVARLTVLAERLPEALPILGEVVMAPTFPAREVERLKGERLAELLQLQAEPRGLADEMFARFTYDAASRYATPEGGTAATVAALTRTDIEAFYGSRYGPASLTLVIAGDITLVEAVELAERTFGGWSTSVVPSPLPSARAARATRAVHLIAKGDAPQSELRIGHMGLPRLHPDYFPVVIMNAVLGGLFSSRINLNLREAHAYTYGAFSSFEWRRGAGPFVVSTAVRSDVTEAAIGEILTEIDRMRAEEIGEAELSLATSYLDGVFPIRYETTAAVASALANLVVFGLPKSYYDGYREHIRAVTRADVLEAARKHLHPEALQIVVVGDPAAVREPLEGAGLGETAVYDAEGNRV